MAEKNTMAVHTKTWMEDPEYLALIRRSLMQIAALRMPQASDAEEVVQQAIQVLLEDGPRTHLRSTPLQYGAGILKHKIRDYHRAATRLQIEEVSQDLEAPTSLDEELQGLELRELMKKHIRNMPGECRRIFAHLYLGYTPFEMQRRIKAPSLEALKMRVSRCRRGLKRLLAKAGWEFEGTKAELSIVDQCTDRAIGSSLPFYEASSLNEVERRRFERHVAECSFCAGELYDFLEVSEILREDRSRLFLNGDVQTVGSLGELADFSPPGLPKPEDIAALQKGFKYWARIGLQVLLLGLLLAMAWPGPGLFFSTSRYDSFQSSEEELFRLPKEPPLLGFWAESQQDPQMREALDLYRDRKFWGTLRRMAAIRREEPADWQVYFIAGMSSLYVRIAEEAPVSLLERVLASASREGFESEVRWYLAAALWEAERREETIRQLERVVALEGSFKAEAQEALRRIREQEKASAQ